MNELDIDETTRCSIRGGDSFHVEYVIGGDMEDQEVKNLTHQNPESSDDFAEDDLPYGWVVDFTDVPGVVALEIWVDYGGDGNQELRHHLTAETCLQLSDMFRLAGERALAERKEAEANDLALQIEDARINQALPFGGDEIPEVAQ